MFTMLATGLFAIFALGWRTSNILDVVIKIIMLVMFVWGFALSLMELGYVFDPSATGSFK